MQISAEVREALAAGRPVVALESTIVAHGLPRPDNVEVARQCEAVVREAGAIPATIAVVGGEVRVGLGEAALERIGSSDGVAKCSVRDLPVVCARGGDGATTVAATAHLAARAGFYLSDSGHPVPWRADSPQEVAAVMRARAELDAPGGILVANPLPVELQL